MSTPNETTSLLARLPQESRKSPTPESPYLRHIQSLDNSGSGLPGSPRPSTPVQIPEHGSLKPNGKSYWSYYIPAMAWIPHYQWKFLAGDVVAGVTLASFQIPVSMSYANSLANVPTVSGLYGLVVPPLIYALLGSVPQMVVGPEAAISLVVGQAVSPYLVDTRPDNHRNLSLDPEEVAGLIAGTGGAVLLIGGLLRFGFLDSVLSRALLRGFISAVGLTMIIDQLPAQLGLTELMHRVTGTHPTSMGKLVFVVEYWREAHAPTTKVALTAFAAIMALRITKRKYSSKVRALHFLPEILLVVIVSTCLSDYFDLHHRAGLDIVGDIKPGRVKFELPITPARWLDFKTNFSASFFAAILGFFESTIAAKSLGSQYDINISTNRELVALGMVNLMGSLVSALPSFGGYARSKVNAASGAKTQMAGVVLSCVTMLSIAFLMPYFYFLPNCILSSIISVVGFSLLEEAPADIKFYWKICGYQDLATLFATMLFTLLWSVQTGIAVGVGMSLMRVIHHATRPRIQILGRVPGTNDFRNADEVPDLLEAIEGCLIVKIPEPLTFVNTGDLRNRLRRLEFYGTMRIHPSYPRILDKQMFRYLILDMQGMTECDASAVQTLHELVFDYVNRGIRVIFVRMPMDRTIRDRFEKSGITDMVKRSGAAYFETIDSAIRYVDRIEGTVI